MAGRGLHTRASFLDRGGPSCTALGSTDPPCTRCPAVWISVHTINFWPLLPHPHLPHLQVRQCVHRLLGGAEVAASTPLSVAGMDSLGALELRKELGRWVGTSQWAVGSQTPRAEAWVVRGDPHKLDTGWRAAKQQGPSTSTAPGPTQSPTHSPRTSRTLPAAAPSASTCPPPSCSISPLLRRWQKSSRAASAMPPSALLPQTRPPTRLRLLLTRVPLLLVAGSRQRQPRGSPQPRQRRRPKRASRPAR